MARPRTPIGTFGDISFINATGGQFRARTRFRDDDGKVRRVSATGLTKREAERNLKKVLAERSSFRSTGELTPNSSFTNLVDVWLADLDLEGKLAESTRALYERNMRKLVMPVFEGYALREITVSKVDRFLKGLAANKSYSMAKQARTVLSLAFALAVRYDAIPKNPVRETSRLRKPPSQAMALSAAQSRCDSTRGTHLAARPRALRPTAGRSVGADHRGYARHVGSHRRGARHPQMRCRRDQLAGYRADLRDDRFAGR
jgi:hypothetical protein